MGRREVHRRKPSRAATWAVNILITLMGIGGVAVFLTKPEIFVLTFLALGCVGAILLTLKVKAWIQNVWWPRFIERRMMTILGNSVTYLHKETGRIVHRAVWPSPIMNVIVEATHELESRGRELASLRAQVTELTAENKRLKHAQGALTLLTLDIQRVMNALCDTPSDDLVKQDASGNVVPDTSVLARTRHELGVSVIAAAAIAEFPPELVLTNWTVMSSAARQVLGWARAGEMTPPLPENWVRAIENRILDEELKRRRPPTPAEA